MNAWLTVQKQPHAAPLRHAKIDALPIGDGDKALLKEQPSSEDAKKLAKKHEKALAISDDDYRRAFSDEQRRRWDTLKEGLEAVKRPEPRRPQTALAIVDRQATPEPTWLLDRGDFYAKKEPLQVGFLHGAHRWKAPSSTGSPCPGETRRIAAPASGGRWRTGSPTWIRVRGHSCPG